MCYLRGSSHTLSGDRKLMLCKKRHVSAPIRSPISAFFLYCAYLACSQWDGPERKHFKQSSLTSGVVREATALEFHTRFSSFCAAPRLRLLSTAGEANGCNDVNTFETSLNRIRQSVHTILMCFLRQLQQKENLQQVSASVGGPGRRDSKCWCLVM